MKYKNFIKKWELPDDFVAPTELNYDDLIAKPLTRADLQADIDAVNSSLEIIRKTRGGTWPSEPVSEEFDELDLAWHHREFRDKSSFAYVIYDQSQNYIGCLYLYPLGVRTDLNQDLIQYDVDASWRVTAEAYKSGFYEKLFDAINQCLAEFPFEKPYFSNKEIPTQGV